MKSLLTIIPFLMAGASARADMPSTHGMLLFGEQVTYASHLPMFHAPHDYQVILKLKVDQFTRPSSIAFNAYKAAQAQGKTLFTIEPEKMDLTKVISGEKTSFIANIYDGHFEQGGALLGKQVFNIEKVVFSKKLNAQEPAGNFDQYIVFGELAGAVPAFRISEFYAAHLIGGKPNLDAIVKVSPPYTLKFPHCRTRACGGPIKEFLPDVAEVTTLTMPNLDGNFVTPKLGEALGDFADGFVDVEKVLYVEEAELSH